MLPLYPGSQFGSRCYPSAQKGGLAVDVAPWAQEDSLAVCVHLDPGRQLAVGITPRSQEDSLAIHVIPRTQEGSLAVGVIIGPRKASWQ